MRDLIQSKIGLGILGMLGAIVALLGGLIVQQRRQAFIESKVAACKEARGNVVPRNNTSYSRGGAILDIPTEEIKKSDVALEVRDPIRVFGSSFPEEVQWPGRYFDRHFGKNPQNNRPYEAIVKEIEWSERKAWVDSPCASERFAVPFDEIYVIVP